MCIPDNYDYFKKHQAEQDEKLNKLPVCEYCEEPIQDDYYYEIDNECICEECLNDYYRKYVNY